MYLLAPFCKIFKKFQSWGCAIFRPKMAHLSWTKFFGTNHYYYFHLPIGPFHCAKFKKNSCSASRIMRMCHFWYQNGPLAPNKNVFGKLLKSFSSSYYPFSLCKIFKTFFQQIHSYEDVPIFGPKMAHFPKWEFFS